MALSRGSSGVQSASTAMSFTAVTGVQLLRLMTGVFVAPRRSKWNQNDIATVPVAEAHSSLATAPAAGDLAGAVAVQPGVWLWKPSNTRSAGSWSVTTRFVTVCPGAIAAVTP